VRGRKYKMRISRMEGENAFDNNITHGDEHILDGTNNVIYCKQNNLHMTSQPRH